MSLLMDALKKAELEKKEAAEKAEHGTEQTQAGTDDADAEGHESSQQTSAGESAIEQPVKRLDRTLTRSKEEIFAATAELKLEPLELEEIERKIESDRKGTTGMEAETTPMESSLTEQDEYLTEPDETAGSTIRQSGLSVSPAETDGDTGQGPALLDEDFSDDELDADLEIPGLFDETIEGDPYQDSEIDRVFDETLPGVSAIELAKDLGEENQPTPVAAQTVFTASATTKQQKGLKWPIIIGLTVVFIVAGGVVVFESVTPLVSDIPSQQLAGELELIQPPETVAEETSPPANMIETLTGRETETPTETAGEGTEGVVVEQGPEQSLEEEIQGSLMVPEPLPEEVVENVPGPDNSDDLHSIAMLNVDPGLVKISRSSGNPGNGLIVNQAYTDFRNGKYEDARTGYEEVLKLFPDNRDALLGLGAIAMREGDVMKGYEIYSRLFRVYPHDPLARAIIVSLDSQTEPVTRASMIKLLIHDNPDESFLYFTLGNIYAKQSRWAEAQQAFFDAYRNDSTNPDYALNLAISLDHLGQAETALDYYNTALKLSDAQPATFDSSVILARIQALTSSSN